MKLISQRTSTNTSPVAVVFCVRNEKFRLPYFLQYYREMGIAEFYAVDNGSDDGTREYLADQADVELHATDASYKSSNAGRDWTSQLCEQKLQGRWCLTLDVDEFFVYPYMEAMDLDQLIGYLEAYGYQGVASLFVDFYSDRSLSATHYKEGQSTFEVCRFFDSADQYTVIPNEYFPFFELKGGPRQRTFWEGRDLHEGPSMRKIVLVKWERDFAYLVAAHACTPIRLADFTGVIAHFKFLAHFHEFAKQEVARNQRVSNSKDWRLYAKSLEKEDINFFQQSISRKYENSLSLVEQRLTFQSPRYVSYASDAGLRDGSKARPTEPDSKATKLIDSELGFAEFLSSWRSFSLLSAQLNGDESSLQEIAQIEHKIDLASSSWLWRSTYRLRKFASRLGFTDQRSLTEENYANQNLASRFTFIYDSIWWDLLGPFRAILKILRRAGLVKHRK